MWDDLFSALALVFVLEGIMPFLSPMQWRKILQTIAQQSDFVLRGIGLSCMLLGVFLLYVFHG